MIGRLVVGVTVPMTAKYFLSDQLRFFADEGWEVHLVTSPGVELSSVEEAFEDHPRLHIHTISMSREPSPLKDAWALIRWIVLLSRLRPNVVMSGTPKAGLLGILAARATGTKSRLYLLRGLRLEGLSGIAGRLNLILERLTCAAATNVVCVSQSLKRAAGDMRLTTTDKLIVLGSGSSNGVDVERFRPASPKDRTVARRRFGIPKDVLVVGFAGRLTHDKGLHCLIAAMQELSKSRPQVCLVVAGSASSEPRQYEDLPRSERWFHLLGQVEDMPTYYKALDVFCLPSLREGFPNTSVEALATGIPVVTTDATGCFDTVENGVTGLLVPAGDGPALSRAVEMLIDNEDLRTRMGAAGREQVLRHWRSLDVWMQTSTFLGESIT